MAAIRDAVARVRAVLPAEEAVFRGDRTAREVVLLNLFVAIQECIDLASHWLADEGWDVPSAYRDLFSALAEHGVISTELADRMGAAAGLRDLVAHRYGSMDWQRVHEIASGEIDGLLAFAEEIARGVAAGPEG